MKAQSPRSSFFQTAAGLKPEFRDHLDLAWELTEKQRATILTKLLSLFRAEVERTIRLARDDIVDSVGGDPATTLKVVTVLEYLWSEWSARFDTATEAMRDFVALNLLPKDRKKAQIAKSFLQRFFRLVEKESPRVLRSLSAGMILPNLVGIDTVADFRAVERGEYAWSTEAVAKYKPEIIGLVPVVVVSIRTSKEDRPIVFQGERHELEELIRKLQSSIKLLDAGSRFVIKKK